MLELPTTRPLLCDVCRNGVAAAEIANRDEAFRRSPYEAKQLSLGCIGGAGRDAVHADAGDKALGAPEREHDEAGLRAPDEAERRTLLEVAGNDSVVADQSRAISGCRATAT